MTEGTGKVVRRSRRLSESDFEVIQPTDVKHHATDSLPSLLTTVMAESPLQDVVPVIMTTETHEDEENADTDARRGKLFSVMMN